MSPWRVGVQKLLTKLTRREKGDEEEEEEEGKEIEAPGSSAETLSTLGECVEPPPPSKFGPQALSFLSINELMWQLVDLLDICDILNLRQANTTLAVAFLPFFHNVANVRHWVRVGGPPLHKSYLLRSLPQLSSQRIAKDTTVAQQCRDFSLTGGPCRRSPDGEHSRRPAQPMGVFLREEMLGLVVALTEQMPRLHTLRWNKIVCPPALVATFPKQHPGLKSLMIEYPRLNDYPDLHAWSHDGKALMNPPIFDHPRNFSWGLETLALHNIFHNEVPTHQALRGGPWGESIAKLLSVCPSLQHLSLSYDGPFHGAGPAIYHRSLFFNICMLYGAQGVRPLKLRSLRLHNMALTHNSWAMAKAHHLSLLTDLGFLQDVSLSSIKHEQSTSTPGLDIFSPKDTPALRSLDAWSCGHYREEHMTRSMREWCRNARPEFIRQLAIPHPSEERNNQLFVDLAEQGRVPRMVALNIGGGPWSVPDMFDFHGEGALLLEALAKLGRDGAGPQGIKLEIMLPNRRMTNQQDLFPERWWWWASGSDGLCRLLGRLSKLEQVELCLVPTPIMAAEECDSLIPRDNPDLRGACNEFLRFLACQIVGAPGSSVKYAAFSYSSRAAGWETFREHEAESDERPFVAWWVSTEGRDRAASAAQAEDQLFASIFGKEKLRGPAGKRRLPSEAKLRRVRDERQRALSAENATARRNGGGERMFPCQGWVPLSSKQISEVELFRLGMPMAMMFPDQRNCVPACQSTLL